MLNTSRFLSMSMSLDRIASGATCGWRLSAEEPDALMCARPGPWEPWRATARATRPDARKARPAPVSINGG